MKITINIEADNHSSTQIIDEEELKKVGWLPVTRLMVRSEEIHVTFANGVTYVLNMGPEMADRWEHSGAKELLL